MSFGGSFVLRARPRRSPVLGPPGEAAPSAEPPTGPTGAPGELAHRGWAQPAGSRWAGTVAVALSPTGSAWLGRRPQGRAVDGPNPASEGRGRAHGRRRLSGPLHIMSSALRSEKQHLQNLLFIKCNQYII